MISQPLTKEDEKILRSELVQILIAFLLIALIVAIIFTTGLVYLGIAQNNYLKENQIPLRIILSLITVTSLFAFGWSILYKPLKDISHRKKIVLKGIITNKSINTRYSYHEHIGANLVSTPILQEYFLNILDHNYMVEKNLFDLLNSGDCVTLFLTYHRKKLIDIKKETPY